MRSKIHHAATPRPKAIHRRFTSAIAMLRAPFIVRALAPVQGALKVTWSDGAASNFSSAWLRTQVRDPKFYITSSSQRKNTLQGYMPFIYTPADVVSAELVPGKAPEEAGVRVAWPDHSSTFNASWLRAQDMSLNRTSFPKLYEEKLWSTQKDLPEYQYGEREERMEEWMTDLRQWGTVLFRGVPTNNQGVRDVLELVGPLQQVYHPGDIFDIVASDNKISYDDSYAPGYIEAHTDGTDHDYAFQIGCFHSIEYSIPESSNESVNNFLVDGFEVVEKFRKEDPEGFSDLQSNYWGNGNMRSNEDIDQTQLERNYPYERNWLTQRPILHLRGEKLVQIIIRSLKLVERAPCTEDSANIERRYQSYAKLQRMLNDPANQRRFVLTPGTLCLVDNYRILHGRDALVPGMKRKMVVAFLSHETYMSRWRLMLGRKSGLPNTWLYGCPLDALEVLSQRWES